MRDGKPGQFLFQLRDQKTGSRRSLSRLRLETGGWESSQILPKLRA